MQLIFLLFPLTILIGRSLAQAENFWSDLSVSDEANFDPFEESFVASDSDLPEEISDGSNLPLWDEGLGFELTLGQSDESSLPMENEGLGFELTSGLGNDVMATEFKLASDCSSSSGALGRRGSTCPDDRILYEVRPSRDTMHRPLFPYFDRDNQICPFEVVGNANFVICDSGEKEDRIRWGVTYSLENATPFDIVYGCFTPHKVWCCGHWSHYASDDVLWNALREERTRVDSSSLSNRLSVDIIPRGWAAFCYRDLDPDLLQPSDPN